MFRPKPIVFNFITDNNPQENTLYIGGITSQINQITNQAPFGLQGCSYYNYNYASAYYFIDNVSLIPIDGNFNLPENICQNQSISNLTTYLDAIPFGGTFSGNGVSGNSFTASTVGINTITYTYTNSSGCSVSIYGQIEVLAQTNPLCSSSNCPASYLFTVPEPATAPFVYNASSTIETSANYLVNNNQTITLTAGNSITFKPNSEIKSGANYLAKIENCPPSTGGRFVAKKESKIIEKEIVEKENNVIIYPNPSNEWIMITSSLNEIKNINIISLDGKIIYNKDIERLKSLELNIANYQKGIYLIIVETIDGRFFKEKLIKN